MKNTSRLVELRERSVDELGEELIRLRKEQFALRMQRASEQLPQTHLLAATRRDIARVKTLIRERTPVAGTVGEAEADAGARAGPGGSVSGRGTAGAGETNG